MTRSKCETGKESTALRTSTGEIGWMRGAKAVGGGEGAGSACPMGGGGLCWTSTELKTSKKQPLQREATCVPDSINTGDEWKVDRQPPDTMIG